MTTFASKAVPLSQEFLDNTPFVKLFVGETVTLGMTVFLKMQDSYDVEVLSSGSTPEGVINTKIQLILERDPLGNKKI